MAGLGFYEFQPETVLTATQVNGYLMRQSVMYFATTSAASASITNLDAGHMAFIAEVNRPYFYDGSAWQRLATKAEVEAQENRTPQVLLYMEVIN